MKKYLIAIAMVLTRSGTAPPSYAPYGADGHY